MIANEIKIRYERKAEKGPTISCTKDAYNFFKEIWEDDSAHIERAYIILVDSKNMMLGHKLIGMGGVNGVIIDPRIVFQTALLANATGIILAHNHPSGVAKPSDADIQVTQKIKKCGDLLQIGLLDHIILGEESYFSFSDEFLL